MKSGGSAACLELHTLGHVYFDHMHACTGCFHYYYDLLYNYTDVPRPAWRANSHCEFDRNKVDLFWIPPFGGKCCIYYLVKEAVGDKLITNTSNTTTSLSYRDLAMGKHKYTVQCVDTADVLSPPSVPLYIYPGRPTK